MTRSSGGSSGVFRGGAARSKPTTRCLGRDWGTENCTWLMAVVEELVERKALPLGNNCSSPGEREKGGERWEIATSERVVSPSGGLKNLPKGSRNQAAQHTTSPKP